MTRHLRVAQLVTTLSRGGAQLTVIETSTDPPDDIDIEILTGPDLLGEGDLWDEVHARRLEVTVVPHLHRSIRPLSDLRCLVWLVRWLRRERPDILHTHSTKAGAVGRLAGRIARIRVVHTVHGWSFAAFSSATLASGVVALERLLGRWTEVLVAVTSADVTTGHTARIRSRRGYALVRSAIDLDAVRRAAASRDHWRRRLELDPDLLVIGAVARLSPQKRIDLLIEAFGISGLAGPWTLVLIGDGPDRNALEELASRLGLAEHVRFTGARADAASLVATFDIFALSSAWEGLPRTLVEAIAAGVPVVATPVGGVTELIRDGETGLLTPVGDTRALAAALSFLASRPDERARLSTAARPLVEAFSVGSMRTDIARVWRECAPARP